MSKNKGFTLIEITLVLALMAAILAIVFIGISAAQRSRRDTQRKGDVNEYAKVYEQAVNRSVSNDDGAPLPGQADIPLSAVSFDRKDPSTGAGYDISFINDGGAFSDPGAVGKIQVYGVKWCTPGSAVPVSDAQRGTGPRGYNFSVVTKLEAGGFYCADDSD